MTDDELLALAQSILKNTRLYPGLYQESSTTLALAHGVVRLVEAKRENRTTRENPNS
jgi:hypothetical protein